MIRINLAPRRVSQTSVNWLRILPWRKIFVGFLGGAVIFSIGLLWGNYVQAHKIVQFQAESENLQRQLNRLEIGLISLRALQNRDAILKVVKSPQAQWANRLALLADAVVPQVWFTYMRFGPPEAASAAAAQMPPPPVPVRSSLFGAKPPAQPSSKPAPPVVPVLILKGSAFVTTEGGDGPVTHFLQGLKEYPDFFRWFSGLELRFVEHRHIKEEEISDFEIALRPKGI